MSKDEKMTTDEIIAYGVIYELLESAFERSGYGCIGYKISRSGLKRLREVQDAIHKAIKLLPVESEIQ